MAAGGTMVADAMKDELNLGSGALPPNIVLHIGGTDVGSTSSIGHVIAASRHWQHQGATGNSSSKQQQQPLATAVIASRVPVYTRADAVIASRVPVYMRAHAALCA